MRMMMMMMLMELQVECSLQSGFVKGMLVLVANRSLPGTYWPASIVMPCGQLLRLRPIGCDDAARDFWCDVTSADVRPISSCRDRQQNVCPPDGKFVHVFVKLTQHLYESIYNNRIVAMATGRGLRGARVQAGRASRRPKSSQFWLVFLN